MVLSKDVKLIVVSKSVWKRLRVMCVEEEVDGRVTMDEMIKRLLERWEP